MEKYNEGIEKFLNQEFNAEEQTQFKKLISENIDVKKEVLLRKNIRESITDKKFHELHANLQNLGNEFFVEENDATTKKSSKWLWLVVIVGLSLAVWFIFSPKETNNANTPAALYAQYNEPYSPNDIVRGDNTDLKYESAFSSYSNKDYDVAIGLFEKILAEVPNDHSATIYLSNCYLNTTPTQVDKAIDLLSPLVEDTDSLYQQAAKWYLSLAYLANDDIDKATITLNELTKEKGKYGNSARAILEKL